MKTVVKFVCGHEGIIDLYGTKKERERQIWGAEHRDCPECQEAERTRKNAEFSSERSLPTLEGTERQVAWAETLRRTRLESCEKFQNENEHLWNEEQKALFSDVLKYLYVQNKAKFWIDNREKRTEAFIDQAVQAVKAEDAKPIKKGDAPKEYLAAPEKQNKQGVARVRINGNFVSFHYPKDLHFQGVMNAHYCKWNGLEWEKEATDLIGTAENIAAEIGRDLLDWGFVVGFPSEQTRDMAMNATFEPERFAWILREDSDHVKIKWRRDYDYYKAATAIMGAKYRKGVVIVPAEYYQLIDDFAEKYDFFISEKAREVLDAAREKIEGIPASKLADIPTPEAPQVVDPLADLMDEE